MDVYYLLILNICCYNRIWISNWRDNKLKILSVYIVNPADFNNEPNNQLDLSGRILNCSPINTILFLAFWPAKNHQLSIFNVNIWRNHLTEKKRIFSLRPNQLGQCSLKPNHFNNKFCWAQKKPESMIKWTKIDKVNKWLRKKLFQRIENSVWTFPLGPEANDSYRLDLRYLSNVSLYPVILVFNNNQFIFWCQ